MATFNVKYRPKGENTVKEETVSANNQSAARKTIESKYSGCKVVACTQA